MIGPFRTEGLSAGFATLYPPETQLDFTAAYPGVRGDVRWHDRADLRTAAPINWSTTSTASMEPITSPARSTRPWPPRST
ncbi:MAG: hypothetical protein M5U12_37685 [Verrucomicrobia bacterium]|nr:hypothetical protein [Verrucomicrobiota bacterium]